MKKFLCLIDRDPLTEKLHPLLLNARSKLEIKWMLVSKANQIKPSSLKRKTLQSIFLEGIRTKMRLGQILMHLNNQISILTKSDLTFQKKNTSTQILESLLRILQQKLLAL